MKAIFPRTRHRGAIAHLFSGILTAGLWGSVTRAQPATPAKDPIAAETMHVWGDWAKWGDQGNGTYRNPVLPSDYSDIDCIRVGVEYYAISSTFHYSPGMVILHSRDLVNWTIAGHAIADLTQIGPELNWNRMNR